MHSIFRTLDRKRLLFLFVMLVALVVFYNRLAESPLSGDGSHYSEISKEMFLSGDYLTPLWNYEPRFIDGKPPLLFWLLGASGSVFGFDTFAMRLPVATAGVVGILVLFLFVRRYFDEFTAFTASLSLIFTHQYMVHAREAVTDGVFSLFFALAAMSFWVARTENRKAFYYLMGLFVGLAVMTRQIPGLFVYAVAGAYMLLARDFAPLRTGAFYGGLAVTAAVSLPWYLYMYHIHGRWFLEQFFACIFRFGFQGTTVSKDYLRWHNYLSIIVSNYEPWFLLMVYGLYSQTRGALQNRSVDRTVLFVFLWAFVPLAIFQMAKVKATQYIVPVYYGFSIFTALGIRALREKARHAVAGTLAALTGALCLLYLLFPLMPETLDSDEFKDTINLIPAVRQVDGDIVVCSDEGYGHRHYEDSFLFYADKRVVGKSRREIVDLVNAGDPRVFAAERGYFEELRKEVGEGRLRVIAASKESVLFAVAESGAVLREDSEV